MFRRLALVLLLGWGVMPSSGILLAAPSEINHQGRLSDALGDPLNGNVAMVFRLYDDSTGGVPLWTETHPAVLLIDGRYNLQLGSLSPLSPDDFSSPPSSGLPPSDRYLEVEVNGEVLTPRTKLVATPTTMVALRVAGDIQTGPGELSMTGDGGSASGTMGAASSTVGTGYSFGHSQGSNVGVGSLRVEPDSVSSVHSLDVDGDGIPDLGFDLTGTITSNRLKIFVDKNGDGTIGAGELSELSKGRVAHSQTLDTDLDGNPELSAQTVLTDSSLIDALDCDDDDDGISDASSSVHFNNAPSGVQIEIVATRRDQVTGGRSSMTSQLNDSAASTLHSMDVNADGISESNVHSLVTSASPPAGYDASMALVRCESDSDDDGVPEQEISASVVPTKAQHAINSKGTGAQNGRVVAIQSETTVDSAMQTVFVDDDGDGHKEAQVTVHATPQGGISPLQARMEFEVDSDDDGLADRSLSSLVDDSASVFTARDSCVQVSMGTRKGWDGTVKGSTRLGGDDDCDGTADEIVESSIAPGTAYHAINSKGTGAQNGRVVAIRSETTVDSALQVMDIDNDGDGISEVIKTEVAMNNFQLGRLAVEDAIRIDPDDDGNPKASAGLRVTADSTRQWLDDDSDGDGVPDTEAEMGVIPGTSWVAIKTKGTGADKNRVIGTTDDTSAVVITESDSSSIAMRTKGGGVIKGNVIINHANRSTIDMSVADSATTITNAVDFDGDGLPDVAVVEGCTADSVFRETTFSYPNAASPTEVTTARAVWASKKGYDYYQAQASLSSITETEVGCDSTSAGTYWRANDFSGSIRSVTIQASTDPLVNPIEHSSGAHLTPGGTWTNASDKKLKENFATINGEELLAKLDQLDISEWNYISEPDDVKHIGPTAQDFQRVFGVGSDGHSISTVDPAGIALAAIKALNEKTKRVDELEAKVAELSSMLEQLIESKR